MSGDLMHQGGAEPWMETPMPRAELIESMLQFILVQRDTFDVSLAFDGISRVVRRTIDYKFSALSGNAEFAGLVVYDGVSECWGVGV